MIPDHLQTLVYIILVAAAWSRISDDCDKAIKERRIIGTIYNCLAWLGCAWAMILLGIRMFGGSDVK